MGTSAQAIIVTTPIQTVDATPTAIGVYVIPEATTCVVDLDVVARAADGTSSFWRIVGTVRREPATMPVAVGGTFDPVAFDPLAFDTGLLITVLRTDVAARAVIYTVGDDGLTITATGDAGQAVDWFVSGRVMAHFAEAA